MNTVVAMALALASVVAYAAGVGVRATGHRDLREQEESRRARQREPPR